MDFRIYREILTPYLRDCLVNLTRTSGAATGEIRWLFLFHPAKVAFHRMVDELAEALLRGTPTEGVQKFRTP